MIAFFLYIFYNEIGDTMKRTIGILLKAFLVLIVIGWISLIFVEYNRYQKNEPMIINLKSETLEYDDGHVYVNYGLGYKTITYERTSLYGREFGHLFIKVRNEAPNNS